MLRNRQRFASDDISIASSSALSRQDSLASFNSTRALAGPPRTNSQHNLSIISNKSVQKESSIVSSNAPSINSTRSKKNNSVTPSSVPHHKAGRVKVGIRCRPAFQDEIDFAQGNFFSIVDCKAASYEQSNPGHVSLTLISGKQRDFMFDYVFDHSATQDYVYDVVARPVVTDVLKGYNGTIFAYGQTGQLFEYCIYFDCLVIVAG